MGCDVFDSAAYALFARDDRYLTVGGTRHLADLTECPCACPVCTDHRPADLRALDDDARETRLAEHNLHVSFAEMRRVREAIRDGRLLELVERRARSHPRLLDGYRTLLDHAGQLERADPASKAAFFSVSAESPRRPEVRRHHERLGRLDVPASVLLTEGRPREGYDACWRVRPPFGPYPRSLSKTYPLTATVPSRPDRAALEAAADGVTALVTANPDTAFTLAHREWAASALDRVPDRVEVRSLGD